MVDLRSWRCTRDAVEVVRCALFCCCYARSAACELFRIIWHVLADFRRLLIQSRGEIAVRLSGKW